MNITWHAFDLRTGRRIMQLPAEATSPLLRVIGAATDASIRVRCYDPDRETSADGTPTEAGAIPGWDTATLPGRTMLVALDGDDVDEAIVWGAMVLTRGSDPTEWVECQCVTLEHYFDRRYTGDLDFTDTDQATIAAGMIDGIAVDGIEFTVDSRATGVDVDVLVKDTDDKTVLDVLTELADADDGLDFIVDLAWGDVEHTRIDRIVRLRRRIGRSGDSPARFEMPGPVVDFAFTEDYGPEHGANDVMAVSSGQGSARPQSDHQVATALLDNGWARFERRYTPAENETSQRRLNAYARGDLRRVRDGLVELTVAANLDEAPRVGVDWWLGDDVEVVLTCPRFPARMDADGRRVAGLTARMRCVGWEIDLDGRVLKPRLWQQEG